jgi:hypothetical protein
MHKVFRDLVFFFIYFFFVEGSYLMGYYMYFIKHHMSPYTISNERLGSVMFSPLRFTILFRLQTMTFVIYSDWIPCTISTFNLSGLISCLSFFFRSFRRHLIFWKGGHPEQMTKLCNCGVVIHYFSDIICHNKY